MTAVIVVGILIVLAGIGAVIMSRKRDDLILRHWAEQNGFEILSRRRLFFLYWFHTRGQALYRVDVRDSQGHVRTGRVGAEAS